MSYKDFVKIKVNFDKQTFAVNELVTGEIKIQNRSHIHLNLEHIEINLILKHQGKGETDVVILDNSINRDYKSLLKNELVVVKFAFKAVKNITYNGYNVTQSILVKTKVDIKEESEKLLRKEKLSGFKIGGYLRGVFKPDFYDETPVIIEKGAANYKIATAKGSIKPGLKVAMIILGIGAVLSIVIAVIGYKEYRSNNVFYSIISCYSIVFAIVYYLKLGPYLSIGKIDFNLENLEGNFCQLNLKIEKRNSVIKEISYKLLGRELVTYDNGSNRSTARHTFYKGPINKIKRVFGVSGEKVGLPSKSLPVSIINNDFEIRWLFQLTIVTRKNIKIHGTAKIDIEYDSE